MKLIIFHFFFPTFTQMLYLKVNNTLNCCFRCKISSKTAGISQNACNAPNQREATVTTQVIPSLIGQFLCKDTYSPNMESDNNNLPQDENTTPLMLARLKVTELVNNL